jgi:bifunctional enzyme CysN/CysC
MVDVGDEVLEAWLRAQEKKDLLRFVTIGSVDDGKSTLIGRLLHDAQGLYEDQLNAVRRASLRGSTRGAGSRAEIDFSLVTDGLQAEREQGITIDVAYRYFVTERRKFIIADTPGHVQYTRNMATGASTAGAALILVDARLGVVQQTQRHAHIAALLGIPHVIACVNKMDLVGWDEVTFERIRSAIETTCRTLGIPHLLAIPVSALGGDNVVMRSDRSPWWQGKTLLEHLETIEVEERRAVSPLRFPVQLVLRPDLSYRGYAGQIVSGVVREGDEIVALPSGRRTRVIAIDVAGNAASEAFAPMSVALRLGDEIDVSRGDMLAAPESLPRAATQLEADLVWMSERPLDQAKTYLLKHTTRVVRAEVTRILYATDATTLEPQPASGLGLNDIARVELRCLRPLFVDPYAENRATGAFILIDSVTNDTVAAGMIAGAPSRTPSAEGRGKTQVSVLERERRLDQRGALVRILAPDLEEARAIAFAVERELFDRGWIATVIDEAMAAPLDAARACANGGLVALLPGVGQGRAVIVDDRRLEPRHVDIEGLVREIATTLSAELGV